MTTIQAKQHSLQWRHNVHPASQISRDSTVCLSVCLDEHQRKHQSPRCWPFVRGTHRWPVASPHKEPVTRKSIPFDDVIMCNVNFTYPRWHGEMKSNAEREHRRREPLVTGETSYRKRRMIQLQDLCAHIYLIRLYSIHIYLQPHYIKNNRW